MKNNELRNNLAHFGFPLLEVTEEADANVTLAEMVKSHELRLWEGFPGVLASSNDRGMFDRKKVVALLLDAQNRELFGLLVALSLALYKVLKLKFSWTGVLLGGLSDQEKQSYEDYLKKLKTDDELNVQQYRMSNQRLKVTFERYFKRAGQTMSDLLSSREEMGLERALSQVFSPKQKELFLKKLKSEKMTKTEKEYFSRVVKKKVAALANAELHRLAQEVAGG